MVKSPARLPAEWIQAVIVASLFLIAGCAPQSKLAESGWSKKSPSELPTQEQYPDAGAIVLFHEGKMEVFAHGDLPFSVFEEHKVVRVLNNRGKQYANVIIPYSSRSEVQEIDAQTISPQGAITPLDKSTIFDVTLYPNFIFYSDQRAKIFTMPAVEEGSIIEYRYQVTLHDPTLWHAWNFQDNIPTLQSRFTLIKPSEWDILYRSYGPVGEPEFKKAPQGFKSTHIWEMKNVPALKTESAMPPQRELLTRVALAPIEFKSWNDVSHWLNDLWSPCVHGGPRTKEIAAKVTAGATGDEEKLRRIFNWVQSNVRYIAVEIGIGGYQPHQADDVCTNLYGDCKDMTILLCSLAREAGIDLQPAFLSTWFNGKPDTSLPSPLHFDHVIAHASSIGTKELWLDATDKGCPFKQLPWYDQGLPVLLVHKNSTAELAVIPCIASDSNRTVIEWNVQLDTTGTALINGHTTYEGVSAAEIRNDLIWMDHPHQRKWLETSLAKQSPGIQLDSFFIAGLSPLEDSLVVHYFFRTNMFAQWNSRQLILNPWSIAMLDLSNYFRSPTRTHPLRFQFGERILVNLNIALPVNIMHASVARDSVITQFGSAFWQWSCSRTTVSAEKEYSFYGNEIAPDNYPAFRQFLDNIRRLDTHELILEIKEH